MAFEAIRQACRGFGGAGENLALRVGRLNPRIDDWESGEHEAKDAALDLMASYRFPQEAARAYRQSLARWKRAVESTGDCEVFEIEARTRVLLGTGNASVFEFGFNLSHPWGTPYISGTSLKGLVSSYLARHGGKNWWRSSEDASLKSDAQVELFGGVREKSAGTSKAYAGSLIFHDAVLAAWTPRSNGDWFDLDIITPHHPGYYGEKRLPDGTESPIPIKIAALCPGLKFLVAIQGPREYRTFARKILLAALEEEGIGGKTSVGYGRFAYVPSAEEENERLRSLLEGEKSPAGLAEIYKEQKNNAALRGHFRAALERIGYAPELRTMFEAFCPLRLLKEEIDNQAIKDLKTLNQRYKGMKSLLDRWREQEQIDVLKNTDDARELFKLIVTRWKGELAANTELSIVQALSYGWEDLTLTQDRLLAAAEDPAWVWPPLKDLPAFLEKHKDEYDPDALELIAMTLEDRMSKA